MHRFHNVSVERDEHRFLAQAAERCPPIEDEALRDVSFQQAIRNQLMRDSLGAFERVVDCLRERLDAPPYFVRVMGLPVEIGEVLLVAVSASLGTLVEPLRQPWSRVVQRLRPSQDAVPRGKPLVENFHTDGTAWIKPNDYTCMFCINSDPSGGLSRLLTLEDLTRGLEAAGYAPVLSALSANPVPWAVSQELGGGAVWEPVLDARASRIRWMHYTVTSALERLNVSLTEEVHDALTLLDCFLETAPCTQEFPLCRGELLVVDNRRCLHSRSTVPNPLESPREILRTRVAKQTDQHA